MIEEAYDFMKQFEFIDHPIAPYIRYRDDKYEICITPRTQPGFLVSIHDAGSLGLLRPQMIALTEKAALETAYQFWVETERNK